MGDLADMSFLVLVVLAGWQLLALVLAKSSQLVLERQARTPRHQSAAISLLLLASLYDPTYQPQGPSVS